MAARVLAAAGIAVVLAAAPLLAASKGVRFRTIAEGTEEARTTGKPLLFFFTAEWCQPCHELRVDVFRVGSLAEFIEKEYVPVDVLDRRRETGSNEPDVAALLEQSGVRGFPTLLVCRPGGVAAIRQLGYSSRADTLDFLRQGVRRLGEAERKQSKARKS